MTACVARIQDGFFHSPTILPADWLQDVGGDFEYMERARLYPTGRHWVYLITPTLLAHQLIRSEREGDWLLQQLCVKRLLPYFFIAGHYNYGRYLSSLCLEMSVLLPAEVKYDLLSSAFVADTRQAAGTQSLPISSRSRRQ